MADPGRWNRQAVARTILLAGVLGLTTGYAVFYAVFPSVSVPASSEASVPVILGMLVLGSVLVGLATDDLVQLVLESFLALFLAGAFATAMALSPMLVGVVFLGPDSVAAFLLRYGFVFFALGFFANLLGGTAGLVLRERYVLRRGLPYSWERK